jgi:hypothetical protein
VKSCRKNPMASNPETCSWKYRIWPLPSGSCHVTKRSHSQFLKD